MKQQTWFLKLQLIVDIIEHVYFVISVNADLHKLQSYVIIY